MSTFLLNDLSNTDQGPVLQSKFHIPKVSGFTNCNTGSQDKQTHKTYQFAKLI